MTTQLRRNKRITLTLVGDNAFEVRSVNNDILLDSTNDYFIYMSFVNFKKDGVIEGIYLGEIDETSGIIDRRCKDVSTDGNTFTVDNKIIRTARMVAVNNKERVIVIIQS